MRTLALLAACHLVGCAGPPPSCHPLGTNVRVFDLDSLTLPRQRVDYAIDLNGDRHLDNQLGNVVGVLTEVAIPAQMDVDDSFSAGTVHLRLQVVSADPAQLDAQQAGASLNDLTIIGPGGGFCATLSKGDYHTPLPFEVAAPNRVSIVLPFFNDVRVDLTGAQLDFQISGDTVSGQLHGGVPQEPIDDRVVPAIADYLNKKIQGDPNSAFSKELASIFDEGGDPADQSCAPLPGCRNPPPPIGNGACAKRNDGIVDICEVSSNYIVVNVLSPDVQLFSDDGSVYQPSAGNQHKDSLSVGIAFTGHAVQ